MKGAKWAQVDEKDFKQKLRKFRQNSNIPSDWAKQLSPKIIEKFSWKCISGVYDEALGELLS